VLIRTLKTYHEHEAFLLFTEDVRGNVVVTRLLSRCLQAITEQRALALITVVGHRIEAAYCKLLTGIGLALHFDSHTILHFTGM
jgi:hypothetical protein